MRTPATRSVLRWTALPVLLVVLAPWLGAPLLEMPALAEAATCCCSQDAGDCCCLPDGGACGSDACGTCPGTCGSRTSPVTLETSPPPATARGIRILAGDVAATSRSTAPAERPPIAG
ncbi:MAG: hypothetical protein IPK64_15920 [bacterium]|nr:hypothetical protein [bacterium]